MKLTQLDYVLDIYLSDQLGSLSVASGELVYCEGNEEDIKEAIIKNLDIGQLNLDTSETRVKNKDLKNKLSLIFPELLYMNDLSLMENLRLFFDSRSIVVKDNILNEKLNEFDLNPSRSIASLNLVEKIDFLICRTMLANLKVIFLDSTILQLNEYDQDRIMAELIMHSRENACTLILTQFSDRLINSFPGRINKTTQEEATSAIKNTLVEL